MISDRRIYQNILMITKSNADFNIITIRLKSYLNPSQKPKQL